MRYGFSVRLHEDVSSRVRATLRSGIAINLTAVAEAARLQNLAENVAREDIEWLVMQAAQLQGAAIEFDGFAEADLAEFACTQLMQSSPVVGGDAVEDRAAAPPDLGRQTH
ncbi:MAG: hypothetical protein E5W70_26635 [Mesorhizobium sp.]|uniref:hypothetical protein n=1 Tax=unclassified Mesorhizobium TaxID=325217 RepID=UPI00121FE25D|nr:hypothetical protein [Mesorhizobium sp.]TIT19119.1 MAG: hypothetical protein E5W70_26635 [Mesorhizobium sp.]